MTYGQEDMNRLQWHLKDFRHVRSVTEHTPPVNLNERQSKILHACMGIVGEGGEILEIAKKQIFQYKKLPDEQYEHELGDLLWYVDLLMEALGLDLADILKWNAKKLRARHSEKFVPNYIQSPAPGAEYAVSPDFIENRNVKAPGKDYYEHQAATMCNWSTKLADMAEQSLIQAMQRGVPDAER